MNLLLAFYPVFLSLEKKENLFSPRFWKERKSYSDIEYNTRRSIMYD